MKQNGLILAAKLLVFLLLCLTVFVACGYDYDYLYDKETETESESSVHTHTPVTDSAVAPTCTETGLTEGSHCAECSEVLVMQEIVPAKRHIYEKGVCKTCGAERFDGGLLYTLNEEKTGYLVTGIGDSMDTELMIPEVYNGLPVIGIDQDVFRSCEGLTSVRIPEGMTSIPAGTFTGCGNLTSVVIPDSVTSIGEHAFSGCSSLTEIKIPESVTSVGKYAFEYCTSLTEVEIPDGVSEIGQHAFLNCRSLKSVVIPCGLENIGIYAFSGCPIEKATVSADAIRYIPKGELKEIVIRGGTGIDSYAFYHCGKLENVVIEADVGSIGNYAFSGCSSLTSVRFSTDMTVIGAYAFGDCGNLSRVEYEGTKAQWIEITKWYRWDDAVGSYTIVCTDGEYQR